MAGAATTTDSSGLQNFLRFDGSHFKWKGSFEQLKSFFEKPPLSWKGEWNSPVKNEQQFKLETPSSSIKFFESTKTLQIQGKENNRKFIETRLMELIKQPANQKRSPVPDNKRRTRDSGSGESRLDDSIAINTTTSVLI